MEAVLSCFLLIFGICMLGRVFHGGMGYGRDVEGRILAAQIAQSRMEELRSWNLSAHQPVGPTPATDWSAQTGAASDPLHPDYRVTVQAVPHTLYSPCLLFESRFPPGQRRVQQTTRVTVTVTWHGSRSAQLVTLLAPPTADWTPDQANPPRVEIQTLAGASPLPPDGTLSLSARFLDPGGRPVPDVVVHWKEVPLSEGAHGTLTFPQRNANQTEYVNRALLEDGTPVHTGGTVVLEAYADYNGARYSAQSERIGLSP